MKLYFARHGQTDANANLITSQSNMGLDEPLNELGIQQATELAKKLKNIPFDIIISSPLKRAYQTALLVNEYHHLPIEVNASWQEREMNTNVDKETWNNLFDFDTNVEIENVEPLTTFFKRIYNAMDDLTLAYTDKTILIVSHGGVQHAVSAYANKFPLQGNMRVKPMLNCEFRIFDLN